MNKEGKHMDKNIQIENLYQSLKHEIKRNVLANKDFISDTDKKDTYIKISSDSWSTSRFEINLSKPYHIPQEYFGVYLSVSILLSSYGILFQPNDDGFFAVRVMKGGIETKLPESISTYEVHKICHNYMNLFSEAYEKRDQLVFTTIEKAIVNNPLGNQFFQEIYVDFSTFTQKDKSIYKFYFDQESKMVFLNDITGSNYRSVTNGVEKIATKIYKDHLNEYDCNKIIWINMFINVDGNGIVFQKVSMETKTGVVPRSLWERIRNKKAIYFFKYYDKPTFSTYKYIDKKEVIQLWLEILNTKI